MSDEDRPTQSTEPLSDHDPPTLPTLGGGAAVPGAWRSSPEIEGFEILDLLGEGGMGTVFLAEQRNPRRPVALKVVRQGFGSDQAQARFEHDYLKKVMQLTGGSVAQAALLAQRNRTDFYKLLKRHKISGAQFKEQE